MRAVSILVVWATCGPLLAAPVAFHVSEPVGPGETVLLFGDGLGPDVKAQGWRVPDAAVSGPPGAAVAADSPAQALEVLQASDLAAKVLLPAPWAPGVFALRLATAEGTTDPILVNRAQPWWWQGGEGGLAFSGESLRVFGNNLGAKTRAWLSSAGGASVELPGVQAEKYAARFTVPADLPPGEYGLWVHNGFGGPAGFGGPLAVRLARREPWPSTQFNVRDFGARGDQVTFRGENGPDDTPAFEAALARAAANGGGVVFVPRGTYKITAKLVIPPQTVLRGERREWVWLYTPKVLPEFDAVLAGNGDFAVEELSIASQTARRMVACPDIPSIYTRPRGYVPPDKFGRNVHLRRLMLQHVRYSHRARFPAEDPIRSELEGPTTIALAGPDMEISDCDVVSPGGPYALHGTHRARICGNRFGIGRCGGYLSWDTVETVIENNVFESRDSEATGGGFQGRAYRVYVAGNTFRHMYGLDREAISFDSPYYAWVGRPTAVHGNTLAAVELSGEPKTWTPGTLAGLACFVTLGKGLGQYIPVVDNSESTITLERPFAVPPDDTSRIALVTMKTEAVVTGNAFSDDSVAVQLYCQCYGVIVDGNRSERTGGMHGFGGGTEWNAQRRLYRFVVCSFNQFLNNDLSQGFVYQQGTSMGGMLGPCVDVTGNRSLGVLGIGNVVRNNTARDNQVAGSLAGKAHPFKLTPLEGPDCVCRDTLVEGNTLSDTPLALDVYPLHRDTLLRNNRVERCVRPLRDDGANTWIHPAERLGYQVQGVKLLAGTRVDVAAVEQIAAAAARQPASAPGLAEQCARGRRELWSAVARAVPEGVTPEMAALLVGLRCDFSPSSALAAGKGGRAEVALGVRTEPWSPPLEIQMEVPAPPGWEVKDGPAVPLPTCQIVTLKSAVNVPSAAETKILPVRLRVAWDGVPLTVVDRLDVARRELTQWMVIGPFANASGVLPDANVQPPEMRLDLHGEYPGLSGPVKWQPAGLSNKYLSFGKLLGTTEGATALAVACLRADRAVPVELTVGGQGGLQMWLRDRLVVSTVQRNSRSLRLELAEGDNILLAKSSIDKGSWELTADWRELSLDQESHVRQVPVAELTSLPALAPPPAKAARPGALANDGGVKWRLVLADDFERRLLGSDWRAASGQWSLRDGVLVGCEPSFLALAHTVPLPVRIEYDARSEAASDLSAFWLAKPGNMTSGVLWAFASGERGSRLVLDGNTAAASDSPRARAAANQWYHVIAQVSPGGKVQLIVDGQELLSVKADPKTLGPAFPGLWTWGTAEFDNVRIYTGPEVAK